ncbi:MAG: amidohydrolase family protein [Acidobacteria bacterium]|nr:amidohydrolase family protein [Acidobacteriota bacterium]
MTRHILFSLCFCGWLAAQDYDLLIRNGRILDGAGNPWFAADIGVKAGRIQAIGKLSAAGAARTIDATGKFIAPGFIDLHSHSDSDLGSVERRTNIGMVAQGITTSVVNQDGRSPDWPIAGQRTGYETRGIGNNAILLVGHGTVRQKAMGSRVRQKATDADLAAMRALVEEGMKDGAWGISAGLEYFPGLDSDTRELASLVSVLRSYSGVYISHERSEGRDPMWKTASDPSPSVSLLDAVLETIEIGRQTGVPVVCSHIKAKGAHYWGSSHAAVRLIQQAREEGVPVYADQYPYETSGSDGNTVLMPLWAIADPGRTVAGQLDRSAGAFRNAKENLEARLADPETAARIRSDIVHEIERRGGASRIVVNGFSDSRYTGKTLDFIARDQKLSPVDAVVWMQRTGLDGVPGGARMRGFSISEDDIVHFMRQEFTATSTDGSMQMGHPRSYGSYPRKIRRFVLERGAISLPFAIRSSTSLPAQILGLKERGLIREGFWADLVIFDLDTIRDRANFEEPELLPEGISHVFVNGAAVVDQGKPTRATPGKVLTPAKDGRR